MLHSQYNLQLFWRTTKPERRENWVSPRPPGEVSCNHGPRVFHIADSKTLPLLPQDAENVHSWAKNSPATCSLVPQTRSSTNACDWPNLGTCPQLTTLKKLFFNFSKWERLCQESYVDEPPHLGRVFRSWVAPPKWHLWQRTFSFYKVVSASSISPSHTNCKTLGKASGNSDVKLNMQEEK